MGVQGEQLCLPHQSQVVEGQKVISTGPYAIVRHPMYLGVLTVYLATPIALGSWWAAPIFALNIPIIVWRIRAEERRLSRDLPCYREYCQKRPYRLLPHIWWHLMISRAYS